MRVQDIRAQQSAAVGTTFKNGQIKEFYQSTSFVPGAAAMDGRQSLRQALSELSAPRCVFGLLGGVAVEAMVISAVALYS